MSEADVQTSLLAEVEGGLGTSAGSRVGDLEAVLQPIFSALPKNEHGGLGHTTVRYALHRIFVQRHGWFIQGLDRAGQSWNGSSPAGILQNQVPAYVQDLFEKRLAAKGFGLHELAVLAATIEHLVHGEALAKLGAAFSAHNQMPTTELSAEDANEILETYMMTYILGETWMGTSSNVSLNIVNKMKAKMPEIYLAWPETRLFIRQVRKDVAGDAEKLDFAMVARVAERLGEQFGNFQDKECRQLKTQLLKAEDRGSGRLRLPDFYKPAFGGQDGSWQFQESVPYLRQLGALDESDPEEPRVIVANYLGSQANCIASSSFYAVCCMDECESLLVHLENDVKAPEATPARIASLVTALPSSTVTTPRELSTTLRRRLDEIADTHSGTVPLHGRLFAQWMHHAYPRECPYPHIAGTTAPQAAKGWQDESGEDPTASMDEIQRIVENANSRNTSAISDMEGEDEELVPWSHEEELLVVRPLAQLPATSTSSVQGVRNMVAFAALVSIAFGLVRNFKSEAKLSEEPYQKFYV